LTSEEVLCLGHDGESMVSSAYGDECYFMYR
jgi:hypothetical protein